MGRPKLTLPIAGRPLIARVVEALRDGGAGRVVIVAPPAEVEGADALAREAGAAGAEVLIAPHPTPDMRSTVEIGLSALTDAPPDLLLLAPADSPGLTAGLVSALIGHWRREPGSMVLPAIDGRRGHPLLLPWGLATEIRSLPGGVGVNALLARYADRLRVVPVADPGAVADLDTPEDYRRWSEADPERSSP